MNEVITFDYPAGAGRWPSGLYRARVVAGPAWSEGRWGRQLEYLLEVAEVLAVPGPLANPLPRSRLWISPVSRRAVDQAVAAGLLRRGSDGKVEAPPAAGILITVVSEGGRLRLWGEGGTWSGG